MTFKLPHFKSSKPIWHTCLLSGIVTYEMLTNHSEQTYVNINDCIILFIHLILGWKYVGHSRLKKVLLLWFLTVTCSCCPY